VTFEALTVRGTVGGGAALADLEVVELWEDVDASRTVTLGDRRLAAAIFVGPETTFGGLELPIAAGGTLDLLVSADVRDVPLAAGGSYALDVREVAATSGGAAVSAAPLPLPGTALQGPLAGLPFVAEALSFPLAQPLLDLRAADLNRDGDEDVLLLLLDGGATRFATLMGQGDGTFAPGPVSVGVATPRTLAVADFDKDGVLDAASHDSKEISIYLGDGAGGFVFGSKRAVAGGGDLLQIDTVDFDRDGDPDVIGLDPAAGNPFELLTVTGGAVVTAGEVSPTLPPYDHAIGDLDRDGVLDVVLRLDGGAGGHWLQPWRGDGVGAFLGAFMTPLPGGAPGDLVLVDLDRDGRLDAVDLSGSDLHLLRNASGPGWSALGAPVGPYASDAGLGASGPSALARGDWDGDGRVDLAVVHTSGAVVTHVGTGLVQLDPGSARRIAVGAGAPDRVVTADFDRDGDPDLLVASTVTGSLELLRGDGRTGGGERDGAGVGVGLPLEHGLTGAPRGVVVGDLDQDGRADAVTWGGVGGSVEVWLSTVTGLARRTVAPLSGPPSDAALADWNRDGALDLVLAFASGASDRLEVWPGDRTGGFGAAVTKALADPANPAAIALGDLDRDGALDVVFAHGGTANAGARWGLGDGAFRALETTYATAGAGVDVALGDWSGFGGAARDGLLDLVVLQPTAISVVLRDGGGGSELASAPLDPAVGAPAALALGDVDLDGLLDAVVVGAGGVQLFQGGEAAAPLLTARGTFALAPGLTGVALVDADRDGDLDLVVASDDPVDGGLYAVPNVAPASFGFDLGAIQAQRGPALVGLGVGAVDLDADLDVVAVDGVGGLYVFGGR